MRITLISTLGVISALGMLAGPAQYAAAAGSEPVACMALMRIDHTHVLDDQNILFYMRNGDIYLNRLSHRAPGLDLNQPFMYRTTLNRICNNDIITVLENHGFGLTPAASTTLGMFQPIDEARAEALKSGQSAAVEAAPVEAK